MLALIRHKLPKSVTVPETVTLADGTVAKVTSIEAGAPKTVKVKKI